MEEKQTDGVRSREMPRLWYAGLAAAGVIVIALAALLFFSGSKNSADALLSKQQENISFPLYYATAAGFTFQPASLSHTDIVVTYAYHYDGNKPLLVSIQPLTPDIDPDQFKPTSDFTTAVGHAYIVDLEDRTTAAVVTNKSFLLINAPQKIAVDNLRSFINSLRPVQP